MTLLRKFIKGNDVNNDLYKAIFTGDIGKVNHAIDSYGLSYCSNWKEGQDLLLTAVEYKHLEIVKLLVRRGCKIEYNDREDVPLVLKEALLFAVNNEDRELITLILDRINDNESRAKLLDSLNLLHLSVSNKQKDIVKLLLEYGADIRCRSEDFEYTPLHKAALSGNEEIIGLLLDAGINLESKDVGGNTSLALAVAVGNKNIVKSLLNRGANSKCKNKCGVSPLIDATAKSYLEIVEELLVCGADVNEANCLGLTPLHIACLLKNKHLISLLLDAGADINAQDRFGSVPCDIVFKKLSPGTIFFENPSLSYFLAKHLAILKTGGFYLNMKNEALYNRFCDMYCHNITVNDSVLSPSSYVMASTIKSCEEELSKMKSMKSSNGFTIHDVFEKMKNPLNLVAENEIRFLQSVELKEDFPLYESIIRNSIKQFKLRNELIDLGQEWFLYLNQNSRDNVTLLPEEMRIQILSLLTNEDIKLLIRCGEEIHKQKS